MKKFFKKSVKSLTILFLIAVFTFSNFGSYFFVNIGLPEIADSLEIQKAQAAAEGDGIIVYGKSGAAAPQYRLYDKLNNTWSVETPVGGATFANTPYFITVKTAPTREEAVVGILDNTGVLYIVRWDGASWTQLGSNIATGLGTTKVFDIVYENISGDAVVVVGNSVDPSYYIWNGSTWSGPTTITQATKTTGAIRWVELASRKTASSDEIALAYADANGDLNALIWSGSAWTEQTAAAGALSTAIENNAAATTMRAFDVEYETLSGDLIITWGNSATVDPRYVTRTAAGTWSGVLTASTFVEIPSIMNIAAEPWDDRIAVGLQNDTTANSNDGDCGIWNGASWVNTVNCDVARDSQEAGDMVLGSGWVRSGADTRAINFYSDVTDLTLDYNYWVPGTGWTAAQAFTPSPNCISASSDDNSFVAETNPFDETQMMIVRQVGTAICTQKTAYAGANAFNFGNAGNGSSLATPSVSQYQPVGFAYFRFIPPPPNTLTIGVTAGSKVTTVNSGDSSVYANNVSCTGPPTCAAFTLNVSNTSVTVGSIKITETGTANATADLSQLALFYDTDGNYSNGVTGQYGATVASFTSEAATVSGSLALTPATTYYFYVRFNASSTTPTYPKGGQTINFQIAANADVTLSSGSATISGAPQTMAGITTIKPRMTGITYGSGLSDGARSSEVITISGYGFGVAPNGSQANCSGAVDTGCVRFTVGGNDTVADVDVSSWSNTSVGWTASTTLATLGGASALEFVSGSATSTAKLTYYIYPNITAISATAAREYDTGDTDGLVMLSGDHFGSVAGTVSSTGAFGNANLVIHSTAEGSCTVGGWSAASYSGNTVCIEMTPASIPDSVYSGSITLNRNVDFKTDVELNFSIMPRIISNTPSNGVAGDRINITGNHFCQSGACPVSPNRSDASNNVKFGSTQALDSDFVNSGTSPCSGNAEAWTHTEICVKVPTGIPTGSQPTKVRTNTTYDSNIKTFVVNSTVPNDPADLNQYKSDGITQISQGGYSTSSTVVLKATSTASMSINMALEVEVKPTGVSFDETGIIQGPTCSGCTSTSTAVIVSGLSDGSKHWRARTKNTTTNSTSSWVCFVDCNINNADFTVDANAPAISNVQSSNVSTNSATITWSTDEGSTSQVQYNTTGSFVSNCATNNDCTALDPAYVTSHTVNLSNLDSGIRYYYRVRSKDIAGNEAFSSGSTYFDTIPVGAVPAKTVIYYAYATTSVISAGATASTSFSIFMPETSASTTSAFLELTGLSLTSGTMQVWVNSQAAKTYIIPANKNLFKIIYKVDGANVNIEPTASSTVYVNPSIDTYVVSSKFVITYKYTP